MKISFENLPFLLFADKEGRIYDHPYYRMAGFSGNRTVPIAEQGLMDLPEYSKLFYIPDCPPLGLDPATGEYKVISEVEIDGEKIKSFGVAAFLEPGFVRANLPAVDYAPKSYILPMWSYTAVGFRDGKYLAPAFEVEYNHRWDPRNYDDREVVEAIGRYRSGPEEGPLLEHLKNCAVNNHCFAAKNLFLQRWEAPVPVSRVCNAECLGCLSLQSEEGCEASHHRINFKPKKEEIAAMAERHLNTAEDAIISFGQGCEGEPLTEFQLIADSITEIRKKTGNGTINLNTNGSSPDKIEQIIDSGLDSIRISLNSPRQDLYNAYHRPKGFSFMDVMRSIALCRERDIYTMINYLVFPGITDQEEEFEALKDLINNTGVNFIHLKNLNIDPQFYIESMPAELSPGMGMKEMFDRVQEEFPEVQLGYFNQAVR